MSWAKVKPNTKMSDLPFTPWRRVKDRQKYPENKLWTPGRGWRGDLTSSCLVWLLLKTSKRVHRAQNEVSMTSRSQDPFSMGPHNLKTPIGVQQLSRAKIRLESDNISREIRLIEPNLILEHPLGKFWKITEMHQGQTKKIICFQVAKRRIFWELGKIFLEKLFGEIFFSDFF